MSLGELGLSVGRSYSYSDMLVMSQDRFEWTMSSGEELEEELVGTLRFGIIIRGTFTIARSSNS